jgi:elongation factor P
MPKASELKTGDVVELDGVPHVVKNLDAKSPSSRGAATLYKVRFTNLITRQKRDESLKGDDHLREADCQKVTVQYAYKDDNLCMFMNTEDFAQYAFDADQLEEQSSYLYEGLDGIVALLVDEQVVSIQLPTTVELQVAETAPAIKGGSASARTKPATLNTGLVVQVPEYIATDEVLKINTTTGKFMSRA